MNNITKVTALGMCTGCGMCIGCEHITFENNALGFPVPTVDDGCIHCGVCLSRCIFDPDNDE